MDRDAKFRIAARLLIARLGEDAPGAAAECAVVSLREGDDPAAVVWIEIVKLALIATGASPLRLRQSLVEILRREATRLMISVAEARDLEDLMETVPEELGHRG